MAEMLLINPRKRRASGAKRRTSSGRRRRRNPITNLRARTTSSRRRTPARPARRLANPRRRLGVLRRRRRNPIRLGGMARTLMGQVQDALIGAGGAIAVDLAFSKLAPMLPTSLQPVAGSVGAGDAVKAIVTVLLGRVLDRPTRGLARKAALGALTVQAHGIVKGLLPASMQVNGLGYYSPAMIADMTNRVGPIRQGVHAYMQPGRTQLLNRYAQPGRTQVLAARSHESGRVR